MKIHVLNTGYFKLDGGAMFGVVPKSLWSRTNPSDSNNMCSWALRSLLIEDGNRLMLIDTGMGDKQSEKFFTVTNTGQNPLVIESVKASCGCTTPSKPEKPIAPGKSDKIEVVFHPKVGQLKQQNKTIRVVANTVPSETVLNVGAFVEKK